MGSIMNGMAVSGTLPFGGTFFVFSDYMRPAARLAAIQRAKVAFVWTHDSIGVGADGPTHQPIEQLAAIRAIPHLRVIRPADANEVAQAWRVHIDGDGPTAIVLARQNVPVVDGTAERAAAGLAKGRVRARRRAPPGDRPRAHRHRLRGRDLRAGARRARGRRALGAARVDAVVGSVRGPARRRAGRGAPAGSAPRSRSRPPRASGGRSTPTTSSRSTASARRRPATSRSSGSGTRPSTSPTAPAPCSAWPIPHPPCRSRRPVVTKPVTQSPIARLPEFGQSPWYDNLTRAYATGGLRALMERDGIRGVTSNPTIYEKALAAGNDYDEQLAALAARRHRHEGRVLGPRHHRHRERRRPAPPGVRRARRRRRLRVGRGRSRSRARHRRHGEAGRRPVRAARQAQRDDQDPGDAGSASRRSPRRSPRAST